MSLVPDLGFIHIPKNAGTSVRQAIAEHGLPIVVSDHSYPHKLAREEIAVLRCPAERFVSAFHYGRKYWGNPVNGAFASASDLAECAAQPDHPRHGLAWVELGNRPEHFLLRNGKPMPPHRVGERATQFCWVYEPQSTWLVNEPAHLLRYRHLAQDFAELLRRTGLSREIALPALNRSDAPRETLSPRARAFVQQVYAADFRFIADRALAA